MGWGSHLGRTTLAVCISYLLFKPCPHVSALKVDLDVWEVSRVISFGFLFSPLPKAVILNKFTFYS